MLRAEFILPERKKMKDIKEFDPSYMLPIILGLLIGRASLIGKLTPFGIAFLAAYILVGKSNVFIFSSIVIGLFSFHGLGGVDYVVALTIVMVLFNKVEFIKNLSLINSSIIAGAIFSITKLIFLVLFKDIFIYDLFIILFEGLVVFTLTYIFSYSLSTESIGGKYTNERIICIFLTLALVLSGFHNISILGLSIKNIISIIFILYFGYTEGAFVGGTIGITLGVVAYVSNPEMPFILSIYGLAGLLTGVFRDLGKLGSILGFILGNGIISFYLNGYGTSFINVKEIFLSIIIFAIIYEPLNNYLSGYMEIATGRAKEKAYSNRKDEMTIKRLKDVSRVFKELGNTFKNSVEDSNNHDFGEVYGLVDDVASSTCGNCRMRDYCWEEGFYTTYYGLFNMVTLLEENQPLTEENIPKSIKDNCINKDEMKKEVKRHFDMFQVNNIWKHKVLENRILVSEQLDGVSNIMENMIQDIYIDPVFKEDVEEVILANLKNKKIDVRDVVVAELEGEKIEVYIDVDKAYKEKNSQKNIKNIVSDTLGMELRGDFNLSESKNERQRFKLVKSNRYNALTEISLKSNCSNGISGDNYTFGEGENNYYVALSDGMGVGKKANKESAIAINLLESFLEAKFDEELTLKTINSILMQKSNEEIFTTFDISLLDLYTGKLQIIKTGAPATFIKKKDGVKIVNSQSLPVGILKDVDFNIYEEYLEDGDIIIMMSDGILEANKETDNIESWMKDSINSIDSLNPKTIADEILNIAEGVSGESIEDDMTVLVTKVWRRR